MVVPAVLETIYQTPALAHQKPHGNLDDMYLSSTHLVESIEFRPRAQRLSILTEQHLRRRSRVDHDDGNIAQLNLINGTKLLRPSPILFRGVYSDLGQISNQGKTHGTLEAFYSG